MYQDWFPRSALELVFELESDRIANLAFVPEVVENERKVVYSERRLRVEDSNAALLEEQVQATAFLAHPYRIPTIGWPSDIQSWSMADLQNFFRSLLRAEQLHADPGRRGRVRIRCLRWPSNISRRRRRASRRRRCAPASPSSCGERRLVLERPGQNPLVQLCLSRDPRPPTRVEPALNLLQTILVSGHASRLNRALVEEKKLAVAIDGGWSEGFDREHLRHSRHAACRRLGARASSTPWTPSSNASSRTA